MDSERKLKLNAFATLGPALIFVLVAVCIIIRNPFRRMMAWDDSWAYARTVEHLLSTGQYQLDRWAAADMPVQIYSSAGLSKIFGYSFAVLRCSTLALLFVALFSFYRLLRELSCMPRTATCYTMALLASPLVLILAFTFMTDVQFLGWLLLALSVYVRGLRRNSMVTMVLASFPAACAIATRQFGVALVAGLVVCWFLSPRERRPSVLLLIAGLALPLAALAMQLHKGLAAATITQAFRLAQERWYLHQGLRLVPEFFRRSALILQYTGMAMLPVLPFTLSRSHFAARRRSLTAGLISSAAIFVAGRSIGSLALLSGPRNLRDPFQIGWLLSEYLGAVRPIMWLLTFVGMAGGAVLVAAGLRYIAKLLRSEDCSPEFALLLGTGAALFALQLLYLQFWDTYLISFVPFGLLALAKDDLATLDLSGPAAWSVAASTTLVLAFSFYLSRTEAQIETEWRAADRLLASGIPAARINTDVHWQNYHGAYDQWIDLGAPGLTKTTIPIDPDPLLHAYYAWLGERNRKLPYLVFSGTPTDHFPTDWGILATDPYRTATFHTRVIWTLKVPAKDLCNNCNNNVPALIF